MLCSSAWHVWRMSLGRLETPLQGPLATLWRLLSHLQPYKQYIPDSLSAVYLPGTGFRAQGLGYLRLVAILFAGILSVLIAASMSPAALQAVRL